MNEDRTNSGGRLPARKPAVGMPPALVRRLNTQGGHRPGVDDAAYKEVRTDKSPDYG